MSQSSQSSHSDQFLLTSSRRTRHRPRVTESHLIYSSAAPECETNKEVWGHRYVPITQSGNITLQWGVESRDTWTRGKTRINTNLGSHYFDLDTSVVQLILSPPQHSTIPGYLIHCILSRVLLLFISAAVMERPSVSAGPLVRVRMDCDVSPLSNVTPGPTINLSLTRLSEMS